VVRGGSWNNNPENLRVSNRNNNAPANRNNNLGFRCAREVERVTECGRPQSEPRQSRLPRARVLHVRAPLQVAARP
jgi:hypothetical protein